MLKRPFAYQDVNGQKRGLGRYAVDGPHELRLVASACDHDRTLVIDPVLAAAPL